jgi:hypothetical protein
MGNRQPLAMHGAIEMRIDVRLCRDPQHAVLQGLCPRSVVLISGRKRGGPHVKSVWRGPYV